MRTRLLCCASLLALLACENTRTEELHDAGMMVTSDLGPAEGVVAPDGSSAATSSSGGDAAVGTVVAADAGAPSQAGREPPASLAGMRLYALRFDVRAGAAPFGCGKPAALGIQKTMVEPTDLRFYVHDVELVRSNGERIALALDQDERWQRDTVALLDFADDTGRCLTNDPAVRAVVYGYAPEHVDYTSIAFKLGVPAEKNHLDGALAPAPYNATGMWWSWSGGYKYMRLDLTSELQPEWYFHAGAAGCSGVTATGFSCAARQIATVELLGWDANTSLITFDAEKFYAQSDLTLSEGTPGCMGTKDDAECAPLYRTLGVIPWDDSPARPVQTAFELRTGPAWLPQAGSEQDVVTKSPADPSQWPDPGYQRSAALDVPNVSRAGEQRSHAIGDPRHGVSCMRCHQSQGPGRGLFTAAGSLFDHEGKPATGTKVEIVSGMPDRMTGMIADLVRHAILEVDGHGNFFTTEPLPYAEKKLTARVLSADDKVLATMFSTKQTGACNTCHTGSFRIELPAL